MYGGFTRLDRLVIRVGSNKGASIEGHRQRVALI